LQELGGQEAEDFNDAGEAVGGEWRGEGRGGGNGEGAEDDADDAEEGLQF